MSSDALKKRKSKVLRSEGGTPEMKRGRGDGEQQVTLGRCLERPVPGTRRTCARWSQLADWSQFTVSRLKNTNCKYDLLIETYVL